MKKFYPFAALLVLLGASLGCQLSIPSVSTSPTAASPSSNAPAATLPPLPTQDVSNPLPAASQNLLIGLYQRVSPGVVSISVLTSQGDALGSGFVYDTQGHVITNYHVVEGGSQLEIDFPSGYKAHGKVIGSDLDSDIAVLLAENTPASELHPLALGDSSKLQVGETVVAIGNPFGLTNTMTTGIVSALGRTLQSIRATPAGQPYSAGDLIQTDAAINPGNSGGPLLNTQGEVIGINRAIRTDNTTANGEPTNSGIGFAVSINIIKRVVPVLIQTGKFDYPYLGISSQEELSLADLEALGLPQGTTGAYVTEVTPAGPADQAGILGGTKPTSIVGLDAGGDLIIAVDKHPVRLFGDLLSYLMNYKSPGDQIVLTIIRNNQQKEVTLTLGKRP
ncbi:MAG: trypsin-like peptidase domain-containing protein [Chloroflexi bacterium]|nr:trypsin-like peptidase domain-containing protein [Chloroflexota bacterium]